MQKLRKEMQKLIIAKLRNAKAKCVESLSQGLTGIIYHLKNPLANRWKYECQGGGENDRNRNGNNGHKIEPCGTRKKIDLNVNATDGTSIEDF